MVLCMWNTSRRVFCSMGGGWLRWVFKFQALCCCRCRPAVRATLDEVHPSYWVKMGLDQCGIYSESKDGNNQNTVCVKFEIFFSSQ